MDLTKRGWRHLDYHDYGLGDVDDAEYARLYRERDRSKVVTREMVERVARRPRPRKRGKRSRRRHASGIAFVVFTSAAICRFGAEPYTAAHEQRRVSESPSLFAVRLHADPAAVSIFRYQAGD